MSFCTEVLVAQVPRIFALHWEFTSWLLVSNVRHGHFRLGPKSAEDEGLLKLNQLHAMVSKKGLEKDVTAY